MTPVHHSSLLIFAWRCHFCYVMCVVTNVFKIVYSVEASLPALDFCDPPPSIGIDLNVNCLSSKPTCQTFVHIKRTSMHSYIRTLWNAFYWSVKVSMQKVDKKSDLWHAVLFCSKYVFRVFVTQQVHVPSHQCFRRYILLELCSWKLQCLVMKQSYLQFSGQYSPVFIVISVSLRFLRSFSNLLIMLRPQHLAVAQQNWEAIMRMWFISG